MPKIKNVQIVTQIEQETFGNKKIKLLFKLRGGVTRVGPVGDQKKTEFKVEESHMKSPPHEWKHKDEYPYNQRSRLFNAPTRT